MARLAALVLALALAATTAGPPVRAQEPQEADDDRHAGYYYPEITSTEVYPARAPTLPDSDRSRRIGFVIGVTREQLLRDYPPPYALYAKGEFSEKLIIVALDRDALASLYQARAMLAQLTALARATPIFIENRVEETYTFLDLLKLLGFTHLTVSDGQTYAHQYIIE
jgi:hypothetical protein